MTLAPNDQKLLSLLQEDARMSAAQLGRKLGVSRTTVQSRLDRLREKGIIAGYSVRLGEEYERGLIQAHMMISTLPKLAVKVENELRRIPEVHALYAISGLHDFIALATANSVRAMDLLLDKIGALEGVDRTVSSIILSTRISR